jgi:hypothetical protein
MLRSQHAREDEKLGRGAAKEFAILDEEKRRF